MLGIRGGPSGTRSVRIVYSLLWVGEAGLDGEWVDGEGEEGNMWMMCEWMAENTPDEERYSYQEERHVPPQTPYEKTHLHSSNSH